MLNKISVKILAIIAALIAVFLICTIRITNNMQSVNSYTKEVNDKYLNNILLLSQIDSDYEDLQKNMYAHIASTEDEMKEKTFEKLDKKEKQINEAITELKSNNNDELFTNMLNDLQAAFDKYNEQLKNVTDLCAQGKSEEATAFAQYVLEEYDDKIDDTWKDLKNENMNRINNGIDMNNKELVDTKRSLLFSVIMFLSVSALGILFLLKLVINPLNKAVNQLKQINDDIQDGSGDLSMRLDVNWTFNYWNK